MTRATSLLLLLIVVGCGGVSDTIATFRTSETEFRKLMANEIEGEFTSSEIKRGVRRLTWKRGKAECEAIFQRTQLVSARVVGPQSSGDVYKAFGHIAAFCTDGVSDADFARGIDEFQTGRVTSQAWKVRGGYVLFVRDREHRTAEIGAVASH